MKYALVIAVIAFATGAGAATGGQSKPMLPKYLQGVGIDQNLNAQVPLETHFRDESGRIVTLRSFLGRRPAVLALVYYTCPMLCDQILRGVVHGLKPLSLVPGKDFDVIAISINPRETPQDAALKRQKFVKLYSSKATWDGWHFLTGDEVNIRAVADAVGYHYRYDPKSGMYFHAAGIMVLTPEGKAARYFYGVEFQPKDLKLGLVEASHNRIGTVVDQILLFCCTYDATEGKYTTTVVDIMRIAAALFFVLLVCGLGIMWRRDIRTHRQPVTEAHP